MKKAKRVKFVFDERSRFIPSPAGCLCGTMNCENPQDCHCGRVHNPICPIHGEKPNDIKALSLDSFVAETDCNPNKVRTQKRQLFGKSVRP